MKLPVDKHGVTIPRRMLGNAEEVEVREEHGRVILEPVLEAKGNERDDGPEEDPLEGLGRNPVSYGASDASEHHDQYLYDR